MPRLQIFLFSLFLVLALGDKIEYGSSQVIFLAFLKVKLSRRSKISPSQTQDLTRISMNTLSISSSLTVYHFAN